MCQCDRFDNSKRGADFNLTSANVDVNAAVIAPPNSSTRLYCPMMILTNMDGLTW